MVSQVLNSPQLRVEYANRLEAAGVRMLEDFAMFIAPKLVSQHLLRGGVWEGQKIDQLLLRLPGAERKQIKLGGRAVRGLILPMATTGLGVEEIAF
jgi:hypothetical protein